jgi:predicted negative regulator of RcsB-dependent stress response
MAILTTDDRNIVEADAINWRLIVYPLLAVLVLLVGGFGVYYYQLNQREVEEGEARAALVLAKTPADMVKVADRYPGTTQASLALIDAASASFDLKDFAGATQDYQRVVSDGKAPAELRDSARLGLGSCLTAQGKPDQAVPAYLDVAHKGNQSPFAPVAYYLASKIYADRKDKAGEQAILQQAVQLGGDSIFVKNAADQLKALAPTPTPAPEANSVAPVNAVPVAPTDAAPAAKP